VDGSAEGIRARLMGSRSTSSIRRRNASGLWAISMGWSHLSRVPDQGVDPNRCASFVHAETGRPQRRARCSPIAPWDHVVMSVSGRDAALVNHPLARRMPGHAQVVPEAHAAQPHGRAAVLQPSRELSQISGAGPHPPSACASGAQTKGHPKPRRGRADELVTTSY
jgi:hypothetical protein